MKIKWQQKTLYSMAVLLLFFSFGFISTAKAQTCDPTSLTVSGGTTPNINGVYTIATPKPLGSEIHYHGYTGFSITGYSGYPDLNYELDTGSGLVAGNGLGTWTGSDTVFVEQTDCSPEPEPEPELVGGFFFKTPPASDLGAGVGTISTDVMGGLLPYIFVCGGLLIGFWLVEKILALIPKDNTMEKADKEHARAKRDIKETERIIASLD